MPQTITIGDALFTKTQQKIMGLLVIPKASRRKRARR